MNFPPLPQVAKTNGGGFNGRVARIEELLQALDGILDLRAQAKARELVQTLLELHGAGMERMLEIMHAAGAGELIDECAEDDLISNLLLLHGLHPLDLETRVRGALAAVKPRLGQHGGSVEFLSVTPEGRVKLRLEGNCHGCPSSRVTLRYSIEEAIYAAAPDVTGLDVDGAVDAADASFSPPSLFTECPTHDGNGAKLELEKIA